VKPELRTTRRHGDYLGPALLWDLGGLRLDWSGRDSVVAGFCCPSRRLLFGPSLQRTTNLELERTRGIRLFN
jgi:hypothetical protein